jgi:hypothetical protein
MKPISAILLTLSIATGLLWLLCAAFVAFMQITAPGGGPSMAPAWLFVAATALVPVGLMVASRWLAGPAAPGHSPSAGSLACFFLGAGTGLVWAGGSLFGIIGSIVGGATGGSPNWAALFGVIALAGLVPGALFSAAIWMHQTGR